MSHLLEISQRVTCLFWPPRSVVKEAGLIYIRPQWISPLIGRLASDVNDAVRMYNCVKRADQSESAALTQWACPRRFLEVITRFTGISALNRRRARVSSRYLFIYCRRLLLFPRCCACAFMCLSIIRIKSRWSILNLTDYRPS